MRPQYRPFLISALCLALGGAATGEPSANPALAALISQAASLQDLDRLPVPVHFAFPVCPEDLRSVSDRVEVIFFIDQQGNVQQPKALSGHNPVLRDVAIQAIAQWRFDPPTVHGRPVRVAASQVFSFAPAPQPSQRTGSAIPSSWGPANWSGTASPEIYDITAVDKAPVLDQGLRMKDQALAVYPRELLMAQTQGVAIVDFVVDTSGTVHNAFAVSATRQEFGQSAVFAASRWKFRPGRKAEQPVNVHMQERIDYSLEFAPPAMPFRSGQPVRSENVGPANGPKMQERIEVSGVFTSFRSPPPLVSAGDESIVGRAHDDTLQIGR